MMHQDKQEGDAPLPLANVKKGMDGDQEDHFDSTQTEMTWKCFCGIDRLLKMYVRIMGINLTPINILQVRENSIN